MLCIEMRVTINFILINKNKHQHNICCWTRLDGYFQDIKFYNFYYHTLKNINRQN
jgi:hypothetical protein